MLLDSIVFVLNMIMTDYNNSFLDQGYIQDFLGSIQERLEFIYSLFYKLEQLDFKDPELKSKQIYNP